MPSVRRILQNRANPGQVDSGANRNPGFVQTEGGITWLSSAGVPGMPAVSNDTALTISAVYRATVLVASTIASFPRRVIDVPSGDAKFAAEEKFLWGRPNPEVSAMEFWETVIGHEFIAGNAFMYVELDGLLRPRELWPILPERVKIYREKGTNRKLYSIDQVPFRDITDGGEICHVKNFGRDGLRGLSLVKLMADTLSLEVGAREFSARAFASGTHPSGVLETDQDMDEDYAQKLAAEWDRNNAGLRNAQRTAVLTNGLKWQKTSLSPVDLQIIEQRKFGVDDVARFTGIPMFMLDPEKQSSWGTGVAEQNRGFVTYTLTPHKTRFDQTISDELLVNSYHRFEFDDSGLLRGLMKDQVDSVGQLVRAGFEPAAALKAVGLPPIAHTGTIPVTVQPLEKP